MYEVSNFTLQVLDLFSCNVTVQSSVPQRLSFPPGTCFRFCPKFQILHCCDLIDYDWKLLVHTLSKNQCDRFAIVLADPPWRMNYHKPSEPSFRGVELKYSLLSDEQIFSILLQCCRHVNPQILAIWVIPCKFHTLLQWLCRHEWKLRSLITWVKVSEKNQILYCHGHYCYHGKEICLIVEKVSCNGSNICVKPYIWLQSVRRGQSQKPFELYRILQDILPGDVYLELFGRNKKIPRGWSVIGNELC